MKLVIGNLKMNLNQKEIEEYIAFFKNKKYSHAFFAPTYIYLKEFVDNGLNTVSQDISPYSKGAYTGDVSANQLKSMGINYSIVGHSERRKNYADGMLVNEKLKRLLENDINPILCIGEAFEERNNNTYLNVIKEEIDEAFKNIDTNKLKCVIIAYEPIWSISTSGTGIVPTNEQISEISSFIKDYVQDKYSYTPKVLYGGSVNNINVDTLEEIGNIDGYLVGGCSLKIKEFNELIEKVK